MSFFANFCPVDCGGVADASPRGTEDGAGSSFLHGNNDEEVEGLILDKNGWWGVRWFCWSRRWWNWGGWCGSLMAHQVYGGEEKAVTSERTLGGRRRRHRKGK
jgi:hypothetical protein